VRKADAEARAGAETRLYREQPALWLKWKARSQIGRMGWSDPPPGRSAVDEQGVSFEDRIRAYREWRIQKGENPDASYD
jgi:hypothetical protein